MLILIDNYDSFSYNLYQLLGALEPDIRVIRNDVMSVQDVEALGPEAVILSPGPGRPEDAGICVEAASLFSEYVSDIRLSAPHGAQQFHTQRN